MSSQALASKICAVGPFSGNGTTNADGKVLAPFVGIPSSSRLGVRRKRYPTKNRLILTTANQVPDLPAKPNSKFGCVGGLNDLSIRMLT